MDNKTFNKVPWKINLLSFFFVIQAVRMYQTSIWGKHCFVNNKPMKDVSGGVYWSDESGRTRESMLLLKW